MNYAGHREAARPWRKHACGGTPVVGRPARRREDERGSAELPRKNAHGFPPPEAKSNGEGFKPRGRTARAGEEASWTRRLTASRVEPRASCPFGWRRLRPQDSMPLAIRPAVRGSAGARARRLPDRMGRRSDTASRLVCSRVSVNMPILWAAGDPENARANGVGIPLSPKQIYLRSYQ